MTTTQQPEWLPDAAAALHAAIGYDYATGQQRVQQLVDTHGPGVLPGVLQAWCDTLLHHQGFTSDVEVLAPLFQQEDSDTVHDGDTAPAPVRWAGRMLVARATDDQDQWWALIEATETDAQWTRQVCAMLDVCATGLRRHANQQQEKRS